MYGASKFALEGLGEALAMETKDLGIKVTLIEPAAYATDFNGSSRVQAKQLSAYDDARAATMKAFEKTEPGEPSHTVGAILQVVDMKEPPLRLLLGKAALPLVSERYARNLAQWERWSSPAEVAQ